ncbi:Uncharacterised protein [Bordetella pertussis]|nr:Uncharacterised protein [Bordetella pertussis]
MWLDTMAATSARSWPLLTRNSRSFRQWPCLLTMMSRRALRCASWICHCMS